MSEPSDPIRAIEVALTRFREHSFFTDECLDMLATAAEDPGLQGLSAAIRTGWSEEIGHQIQVLDQMGKVLMRWNQAGYPGVTEGEEAAVVADFHEALLALADEELAEEWVLEVARARDAA